MTAERSPVARFVGAAASFRSDVPETDSTGQVAIIGVGGVLPGAHSVDQFFRNNLHQRCFIRDVPAWLWDQDIFYSADRSTPNSAYATIAALIEDPDLDLSWFRIPPAVSRMMSRSQKLALICARTALDDAGLLTSDSFDRDRASVIVAAISGDNVSAASHASLTEELVFGRLRRLGGDTGLSTTIDELIEAYEQEHPRFIGNEDTMVGTSPNLVAGRIASAFDLHGTNLTLDAACASSLAAIGAAVNSLLAGDSDLVIAGGVDTWIDVGAFVGFSQLTALASEGCFPFDSRADGLVLGEGCGVVVLKRLEDALRDGNEIYAVIRGVGSSSDGHGQSITVPASDGQVIALRRAYERAGFDPATLDYIECHGTGTAVGDPVELDTIRRLLDEAQGERTRSLPVGSVKSSVGHLRTAAGMAGLFNALNVVQHRVVPPQTGFETPTAAFDWDQAGLHVPVETEQLHGDEIRVGVSAWGFGGTNYHVALSSPPRLAKPPRFDVRDHLLPRAPELDGDVAFLFPGQGSQYVGMLADEARSDIGRDFLARADAIVEELTGTRLSSVIYQDERSEASEARLQATEFAQPAILTVSAILFEMVRNEGIECSMAIGHSLGEYTALYASGVMSFEDAVRAVTRRGQLMSRPASDDDEPSGMVSLLGPDEDTESLLRDFAPSVVRSSHNSYEQLVVAGPVADLERMCDEAACRGIHAQRLGVDRGFHSAFVSHSVAPMRAWLDGLELRQTGVPIPANISRRIYPRCSDPAEAGELMTPTDRETVIDLLGGQIDQPVDFVSQIEIAYRAGVRRFVEIGPSRVLSGLVTSMLQGKAFQSVALDHAEGDARAGIESLRRSLAAPLHFQRRHLPGLTPPTAGGSAAGMGDLSQLPIGDHIRAVVAAVSGYDEAQLGDDVRFGDLGIDSIKLVEIVSRLRGPVLPEDYRGFRNLTTVGDIVAEARTSRVAPGSGRTASSKGIRCHLNRERPVAEAEGSPTTGDRWFVDAPPGVHRALEDLEVSPMPGTHRLVVLPAVDSLTLSTRTIPELLDRVLSLDREMERAGTTGRLALLTVGADEREADQCFRAVTGFMRSVALELTNVEFSYHHVDTDALDGSALLRCLADGGVGRRIATDGGLVEAALEPLDDLSVAAPETVLGADDVVLVTGGARGIASVVVRSLLQRVESRFVLIGQRAEVEPWILDVADRVEYLAADITDADAVRELGLEARGVTLVVHAAGITDSETPLRQKHPDDVQRVLATKILGLENVLAPLDPDALRGIVHFSSIVAHFGNLAQADYAAANGYLDGFTLPSVPVLSIGWTAWDEVGMARRGMVRQILETSGIELLPLEEGVRFFERLLTWWLDRAPEPSTCIEVFGDLGVSLAPDQPSFLALNAQAPGVPVFLVCGLYGYAHRLVEVAREASEDLPFYALEPPLMDWSKVAATTLEAMASWYADQIEDLRPSGPIALLGTSFGGNVVFEIATVLQERGREIELLAMVDAMPPEEDPLEFDALAELLTAQRAEAVDPIEVHGIDVAEVHLAAVREHRPRGRFRGSIQYYLHTQMGRPGRHDRRLLWDDYASGGMTIVPISCHHGQFHTDPARKELADHLTRSLLHADETALDVEGYCEQYASHRLFECDDARWVRLPDGRELPVSPTQGCGRVGHVTPHKSRLHVDGWVLDPSTGGAVREIVIFQGPDVHCVVAPGSERPRHADDGAEGEPGAGFSALVDLYRLDAEAPRDFTVIALGAHDACEIGRFSLPGP